MIKLVLLAGIGLVLIIPVLLIIFSAAIFGIWRALTFETRFRRYFAKYSNEEIGRMIASGKIWTGQTAEQLRDARGAPVDIQQQGGSEIWTYKSSSVLRPNARRVIITDGRVDNWI